MQRYQSGIYQMLMNRFDESELRTLCFNLGVDYDALAGDGKSDKARELISFLDRRNKISDLINVGRELRPDINWNIAESRPEKSESDFGLTGDLIPRARAPEDLLKRALLRLGHPPIIFHRSDLESKGLDYVLTGNHTVTLIQGLPGSGKTILLGELAIKIHKSFPNIFALKFSGPSTLEPSYFIEEINRFIARLKGDGDPIGLQTSDLHRSLQAISDHISRLDPIILLLDAVDQAPSGLLESLIQILPPQTKVVITARSRIVSKSKAQILIVPPLSESEALQFIEQSSNNQKTKIEDENWVVRLPGRIKESPQALSLFVANLDDIPLELMLMDDLSGLTYDLSSLTRKIILSLNSDASHALSIIMLLEDLDLPTAFKLLSFTPRKGFIESLQLLLEKSLVYRQREFYRMPSIVREAAIDAIAPILNDTVELMAQTTKKAIDVLDDKEPYDKSVGLVTITAEFFRGLSELKSNDWIIKLATEDFLEFVNKRGFWKEYWLILRITFEAAKQLNDPDAIALAGFRIIRKSFQVKDLATGRQTLTELQKILEIIPGTKLQAEFLSHKALFTEQDNDIDAALGELEESLQIRKFLGDTEGMSLVQKLMGNIYFRQHENARARESYTLARAQMGENQVLSKHVIEIEVSLALCDFVEKSFESSETILRENIEKCREIGYLAGLPKAYYFLAMVLDAKGQYDQALHFAKMAAELAINSERSVAIGANLLVWKIKNQGLQELEDVNNEG